ncbi:hypothetical protein CLU79DRAFT_771725 [Phycomyces nitens]|nr:hypothetical protein CLU79DRAFT_771725 [Phycomyces nitens]
MASPAKNVVVSRQDRLLLDIQLKLSSSLIPKYGLQFHWLHIAVMATMHTVQH